MNRDPANSRWIAFYAGLFATVAGVIVFIGWITFTPRLLDWAGSGIYQKTNNAIACIFSGIALMLLANHYRYVTLARILAVISGLIGALTLVEHLFSINLGIDTLLFDEPPGNRATVSPNRMGPIASIYFMLVNTALLLASASKRQFDVPATVVSLVTLILTAIPLVGYLYDANFLFTIPKLTGIAFQSTLIFLSLSIGTMSLLGNHGFIARFRRNDPGGLLLRWTIVPMIIGPVAFGWLALQGVEAGLYDYKFQTAALALVLVVALVGLTLYTASRVSQSTAALARNELILQERDRRKNIFIATLAHELRNPLAAMYNATLLIRHEARDNPDISETNELLAEQVKYLVRLVDDLLDISRITSGKISLRTERVDLGEVVRQATSAVRPTIVARRHTLNVSVPEHPLYVTGDFTRLVQVTGNLLNNAAKFTQEGGNITLTVGTTRLNGHSGATISVRDNGCGIDQDTLKNLFTVFYQGQHTPPDRAASGLGIGLALVKQLVEMHGGSVAATSDGPGTGSEFTVSLPVE